jgi:DNA repair protein RadC
MILKLTKEQKNKKIDSANAVFKLIKPILKKQHKFDQEKENFWVIGLSTSNQIKYIDLVAIGSIKGVVAEPREIFRNAIHKGVTTIIAVHNHPSGNLKPSEADKKITEKLREAGKIIEIKLLDHVIITDGGYFSFEEEGL